jgi:sugar phosphate isomerase/epimerase
MTRIAVSTQLFGSQALSAAHCDIIARHGFNWVEVFAAPGHFEWQDVRSVQRTARALDAVGLSVCSLHAPWAPGQDIAAPDAAQRKASLEAVRQAIEALAVLGGKTLVLHPGATAGDESHRKEQLGYAREGIALVAEWCTAHGQRVALENPPPYELAGDNQEMLALYEWFAEQPAVQACFDTGHAHISPEGVAFVRQVPAELLLVHLSDNDGQRDDHLPPGRGTIDWPHFFALLGERHFAGYLVLELTDFPDAERILADGWQWLESSTRSILW